MTVSSSAHIEPFGTGEERAGGQRMVTRREFRSIDTGVTMSAQDRPGQGAQEDIVVPDAQDQSRFYPYPAELTFEELTTSGLVVHLRPIRPDDAPRLVEFHRQLSRQSVYRRFFFMHTDLTAAEVEAFTCVDYHTRMAFIAEMDETLIAVGRYDLSPGTTEAEVAFVVADHYQHHGIATLLLERLADVAWTNGIESFVALTLVENRSMLEVFRDSGFPISTETDRGTLDVRFPIEPIPTYLSARASRHSRIHLKVHSDPSLR
jgi:GNAT superfamily N-acetyltransferase